MENVFFVILKPVAFYFACYSLICESAWSIWSFQSENLNKKYVMGSGPLPYGAFHKYNVFFAHNPLMFDSIWPIRSCQSEK